MRSRSTQTPAGSVKRRNGRKSTVPSERDLERARVQDEDGDERDRELRDLRPELADRLRRPEVEEVGVAPEAAAAARRARQVGGSSAGSGSLKPETRGRGLRGHGDVVLDRLRHLAEVALRREDDPEDREAAADRADDDRLARSPIHGPSAPPSSVPIGIVPQTMKRMTEFIRPCSRGGQIACR